MPEFTIDPEFRDLIPALSAEERKQLETNLIGQGCLAPLIVWRSGDTCLLLDGHNRFEICSKYGIEFTTLDAPDVGNREQAMDWIDKNQLGRRNLHPDIMSQIRGRIFNRSKKPHGGQVPGSIHQNEVSISTAEKLAEEHGVSRATIERDGQFASAVEALKDVAPDLQKQIGTKGGPTKKAVIAAAKVVSEPEEARKVLMRQETQELPPFNLDAEWKKCLTKLEVFTSRTRTERREVARLLRTFAKTLEGKS